MTSIDTAGWTPIGKSDNADFYEIEDGLLAIVPFEGSSDVARTAQQSVQIQLDYLRPRGKRAAVVVFMDPLVAQDASARVVYRDAPDPAFISGYALVGGTVFGRAVGSIFLGLNKPRVPTKMFGTLADALAWARNQQRGHG